MNRKHAAMRIPALVLLAMAGMATLPVTAAAGEDAQAEREARRIEGEARRRQEMASREMAERERSQAEALRGQEEAIRHMEATRSRIEANTQQIAQQSADQARPALPPVGSAGSMRVRDDPVSDMSFAPLSAKLGSYFGVQSGVLVVRAGDSAPFGLQDGDVILSIDGRVPVDGQHATGILRSYQPGERVRLHVQRNRKAIDLDITAPVQRAN